MVGDELYPHRDTTPTEVGKASTGREIPLVFPWLKSNRRGFGLGGVSAGYAHGRRLFIWQDSSNAPLDLSEIFRSLSLFFDWSFWTKSLVFRYVFAKQEKIENLFNFVFLCGEPPTKLFETSPRLTFLHDFQKVYQWHFALNDFFIFQWNFTVYLAPQHFVKENR